MELTPEQKASIEEQKQYCPFCKIVKGEIPVTKVYEDSQFVAILDINPGVTGHTLLLPKEHYPVLPFVPEKERAALATLLPQLGAALQKSTITSGCEYFVANGAAAGQQTSHFLVHLFPVDSPRFTVPAAATPNGPKLVAALKARYGDPKERLSETLAQNPQLRAMIMNDPEEFSKQLPSIPDLARLFHGIDIMALSQQLRASTTMQAPPRNAPEETPRALDLTDTQLVAFIDSKEKLRQLIEHDHATLEMAIETQPKLKRFFESTTIAALAQRYNALKTGGGSHV